MSKYGYSPQFGTSYTSTGITFGASYGPSNYKSLPSNNSYSKPDSSSYSDKYSLKNSSRYGSTSNLASSKTCRNISSYSPDIFSSNSSYSPTISLRSSFRKPSYPYSSGTMDFGTSYISKKPETSCFSTLQNKNYQSNYTPSESRLKERENAASVPPVLNRQVSQCSDYGISHKQLLRQNSDTTKSEYRTLVSRGTSPVSTDKKPRDSPISRTENLNLEVTDTTRKRQLKNVFVQVDPILFRSISINKNETAQKSFLPKQSEFIPKNRKITQFNTQQTNSAPIDIPTSPGLYSKKIEPLQQQPDEDFIAKQTSFIQRRLPIKHEAIEKKIEKSSNSALKESMDKVKSWKKQLQTPEYQDNEDDLEWRKRNPVKRNLSIQDDIPPTFVSSLKPPIKQFNGYNSEDSELSGDKSNYLNSRSSSTLSLSDNVGTKSFLQRASSFTCLTDNLTNEISENGSEKKRQKIGYITKLQDIDSLLDIDDDIEFSEDTSKSNINGSTLLSENFFVGASEDIDDLLDSEVVPSYMGQPSNNIKPQVKTGLVSRQTSNIFKHSPSSPSNEESKILRETSVEREIRLKQHCQIAVHTIESRIMNSSDRVEVRQLMDICRKNKDECKTYDFRKDMKFPGFVSISEALEHMMIDVDKLDACAIRLHELSEEKYSDFKSRGAGVFLPQASVDEYYDPEDPSARIISAARVHVLIDLLKNTKDVRKILFSLKKIFKNDKHCLKEFVHSGGLMVLIKIANENLSNSNFQCYILRAIGQLMLSVDGMNGVVSDNVVIQWLYTLTSLQFYPIVRTSLQLMIVFVEYSQCNSFLLTQAVSCVAKNKGKKMWSNFIDLLKQPDADLSGQFDIGVQVMTLINKVLESIPDQDNFYDIVDGLQDQGIDKIFKSKIAISKSMSSLQATSSNQFQEQMKLFEDMIKNEDDQGTIICTSPTKRTVPRLKSKTSNRKSVYGIKKEELIKKDKGKKPNQQGISEEFGQPMKIKLRREYKDDNSNDNDNSYLGQKSNDPEFHGLVGRAKEGLMSKPPEIQKSKSQIKWEQTESNKIRPLNINGLDFTDLTETDDMNYLDYMNNQQPIIQLQSPNSLKTFKKEPFNKNSSTTLPPNGPPGAPPMPPPSFGLIPPPLAPPGVHRLSIGANKDGVDVSNLQKLLRLHWKESKGEFIMPSGRTGETIWTKIAREIPKGVNIDKEEFSKLFHSKATELKMKSEGNKKQLTILDTKRSNAINIGLTNLPAVHLIKAAIFKMDTTVINREGVEKLLNIMLPTEDERTKLTEAQISNPDVPLGPAENFLLTISSVSELEARLKLWIFILDFDSAERDISDAYCDLMLCVDELKNNKTLKYILAVLLALGNCLNGSQAKGFTLEFLSRVPEIKDSVKKLSLLLHVVSFVMHYFNDSSDFFSEIGSVTRCSKIDWTEISEKLKKLESGCKQCWDYLRLIAKHDNIIVKNKLSDTIADFAERIIIIKIIEKRVISRFHKLMLYFGYSPSDIMDMRINVFCKNISLFSLEWRTTRNKMMSQKKRKQQTRERRSSTAKISDQDLLNQSGTNRISLKPIKNLDKIDKSDDLKATATSLKMPRWPSSSNLGVASSDIESAYESGEEDLLGAALSLTTTMPSPQRRQSRDKRRMSVDRSWRSESRDRTY